MLYEVITQEGVAQGLAEQAGLGGAGAHIDQYPRLDQQAVELGAVTSQADLVSPAARNNFV